MVEIVRDCWFRATPVAVCFLIALTGCLTSGCLNSGSAPGLKQLQEAEANAIKAIENKNGKVEKKDFPPGPGYAVTLNNIEISDDDILHLHAIDGLAELDLSGSTISDELLAHLVALDQDGACPVPFLYKLNLSDTNITDAGLRELVVLKFLAELNVAGTNVTDAGVKELEVLQKGQKLPFGMSFTVNR